MIVTLYLISANVYNSVDAPKSRGFSYIEIWALGSQIPIALALLEYGFILFLKRIGNKPEAENLIKKLDFGTMVFSFIYFVIFASIYWIFSYA